MAKSSFFARFKQRPLIEIIVELTTGVERRLVKHLPFVVKNYRSIRVSPLKESLQSSTLIQKGSSYEYFDSSSGVMRQVCFTDRYTFSVTDVQADLYYGNIFLGQKVLVAESTIWSEFFLSAHFVPAVHGSKNIKSNEDALILASNSFYHFFLEDLPDFLRLYRSKPNATVVVWEHCPSYINEVLQLLGINSIAMQRFVSLERIIFLEKSKVIAPSAESVDVLREYFTSNVALISEKKKVYVSRLRDSRSPSHEEDLIRLLEATGEWTILSLSDLTFAEQLSHAQSATVWMGVHGAGMSWIAMLNPDSIAIEIGPAKMDCFQQLAYLCHIPFFRVECDANVSEPEEYIYRNVLAFIEENQQPE